MTTKIERTKRGDPLIVEQAGVSREYRYDGRYLVKESMQPEIGSTRFLYDSNQNLIRIETGDSEYRGDTIIEYDGWNQVVSINYPPPANGSSFIYAAYDVANSYYTDGSLKTTENGGIAWSFLYDANGNLFNELLRITPYGNRISMTKSFSISYQFDEKDSRRSITYPSGRVNSLNPDSLGRATTVGSFLKKVDYDATGNVNSARYGNNLTWNRTLNDYQIVEKNVVRGIWTETLFYDDNFNVRSINDNAFVVRQFEYDGIDRLKRTKVGSKSWKSMIYDLNGNLELHSLPEFNEQSSTTTYNSRTQLPNVGRGIEREQVNFRHDSRGNMSNYSNFTYFFDNANQLRDVWSGGIGSSILKNEYDSRGYRVLTKRNNTDDELLLTVYGSEGKLLHANSVSDCCRSVYIAAKSQISLGYLFSD